MSCTELKAGIGSINTTQNLWPLHIRPPLCGALHCEEITNARLVKLSGSHTNAYSKGPVLWWDHLKSSWLAVCSDRDWLLTIIVPNCKLGEDPSQGQVRRTPDPPWSMSQCSWLLVWLSLLLLCNNGLIIWLRLTHLSPAAHTLVQSDYSMKLSSKGELTFSRPLTRWVIQVEGGGYVNPFWNFF